MNCPIRKSIRWQIIQAAVLSKIYPAGLNLQTIQCEVKSHPDYVLFFIFFLLSTLFKSKKLELEW